jgi:Holliday junction DNA helicase RuvA
MIAALEGIVDYCFGQDLVLSVNGVGYQVSVSAKVLSRNLISGAKTKIIVYTDVRENAINLFGFDSQLEKEVFLILKKVKGIGSKLAMAIVSYFGPEQILVAIGESNFTQLSKVPGVGKKTAERIVVELREYVNELVADTQSEMSSIKIEKIILSAGSSDSQQSSVTRDAVMALAKLGFSENKAAEAVSKTLKDMEKQKAATIKDAGELVRLSLSNV